MLRRCFSIFGFIVIIKQMFTFSMPFFSMPFLGYDVNTILFYLFIALSIMCWAMKIIRVKKATYIEFGLLVYLMISFSISMILWPGISYFLSDATLFLMPVAVYFWCDYCEINLRVYSNVVMITSILGGIVSLCVGMGILDVGIWAAENDYVRAAGAVNSTLGVCGFTLSICLLFIHKDKLPFFERILCYAGLVGSVVTVLFSFSRTRWVLCVGILLFVLIISMFNGKETKHGWFKLTLLVGIVVLFLISTQTESINKLFQQMFGRFALVKSGDHSVSYRFEEIDIQISFFKDSPFLGNGWGAISGNDMFVHNIYSALLMQAGVASIGYYAWYFSFFYKLIKFRKKCRFNCFMVISFIFQLILIVLNFTNAGIFISGGYFMMILVYIVDRNLREDVDCRFVPCILEKEVGI